mgnify:CR=1 FL=1
MIAASQPGYHARSQTVRIVGGATARIHLGLRSQDEAYETHHRYPTWLPPSVLGAGDPPPLGLSADEQRAYDRLSFLYTKGIGYAIARYGDRVQALAVQDAVGALDDAAFGLADEVMAFRQDADQLGMAKAA